MKGASCWVILLMFALLEAWRLKCLAVANQEESVCQICSCTVSWKGQVVKCTGKNLTQLPSSFPASTKILYLVQNNLTRISRGTFWNLRNLTYLNLGLNNIKYVENGSFKSLSILEDLYLHDNSIESLTPGVFDGLESLTDLMLQNNKISELLNGTFRGVNSLVKLYLQHNNITFIQEGCFENLLTLRTLKLQDNHLKKVYWGLFHGLNNMKYLDLHTNSIQTITPGGFENLEYLSELDLRGNNILSITPGGFKGLKHLEKLMLDNNKISELLNGTFSGLDRLNYLSLINNRIQRIAPGTFEDLKALRSLSLNKNNITEIRSLTFKGLRYVKKIFLENNNITTVEPGAFHSFSKSRFFNHLSIANNKLEIIKNKTFSGLNYLYKLYMDNNDIYRIEATGFYRMGKLRYLYLRGNRLRYIAYGTFYYTKNLYKLDLSRNNISSLPGGVFATLKYLRDLNLSKNALRHIRTGTFRRLPRLKYLHLDFNGIKAIDPRSFSSSRPLYFLNLDGNQLTRINDTTFLGLEYLHQLNLQNNYIREIGKDSFKQMKHLTYLFLHGNRLSKVSPGIFDPLMKCTFLTLNNNNISEIEPHALQGLRTIKTIFLQYNRLLRVKKDDFSSLTRLETLYLFDNEISFFEPGSFPHARLSQLILFKNTGLSSLTIDANESQRINVTLYIYPGNLPSLAARTNTYAEVLDKNGFHCQYRNNAWFCDICPVGTYSRGDGVSTGCHQCPAGGFYQDSVAAVGLTLDRNGCRRCPAGTFVHPKNAPGKASWDCKACPEGTNTTMFAGFRACWCLKAHYRLDRFGPCTACPGKGAECSDDKLNLLRGFYWNWADHDGNYTKSTYKLLIANLAIRNDKYNAQTTRFVGKLPIAYKCLRESSCIGGIDSQCAESYTGPLCANCRRGYYKKAISCHKCPSKKLIAIQFGVLALSILILVLVIIKSNKLSTSGRRTIADIFLAHVKIIIGFYQVLAGILQAFSYIRWPSQVFVLESYIRFVQLNFLEIVSPTCLKENFKMNAYSHFMFTVAANLCIVIFPLFCYLLKLAWVKLKRHQRDKKEDMESKKPHLKVMLFLLFVAYPATCVNIFKILPISCHELCPFEGSSTCPSFLRADYTIECGTNEHKKYTWAAYTSLSYVVAFPIFLTYLVWKNHHQAQKRIKKFTTTETRGNMNQMAMAVLFLHENYSPSCWYWEGIEMARKVILSAGVVFVGSESRTQVGIAAMISGVFAMLHGRFRPIPDRFEDYLQMTSLLVTSFNLSIGLLLKIPSDDVTGNVDANNENGALGILLLMTNALVISIVFARYLIVFIQFIMDCRRNPRFNLGCLNITQETQAGDNDVSLQAMSNESELDKPGINEEENKVCLCQVDDTVIDKTLTDSK